MAIKDSKPTVQDATSGTLRVPKEYEMLRQLNKRGNRNIISLRKTGIRYWKARGANPKAYHGRWRLYTEYCPHGSLCNIRDTALKFGRLLPEAFLWHVFDQLVRGLDEFTKGPFEDPYIPGEHPDRDRLFDADNSCMLHLDLKPANVFVSGPYEGNRFEIYPTVKIGDLGAAEITWPEDPDNPHQYDWKGSYLTPEQGQYRKRLIELEPEYYRIPEVERHKEGYTINRRYVDDEWDFPVLGKNAQAEEAVNHRIMSRGKKRRSYVPMRLGLENNVYGIGQIMWALMTLGSFDECNTHRMQKVREEVFRAEGWPVAHDNTFWDGSQNLNYTAELWVLIRDCLDLRARNRPDWATLKARVALGVSRFLHEAEDEVYELIDSYPVPWTEGEPPDYWAMGSRRNRGDNNEPMDDQNAQEDDDEDSDSDGDDDYDGDDDSRPDRGGKTIPGASSPAQRSPQYAPDQEEEGISDIGYHEDEDDTPDVVYNEEEDEAEGVDDEQNEMDRLAEYARDALEEQVAADEEEEQEGRERVDPDVNGDEEEEEEEEHEERDPSPPKPRYPAREGRFAGTYPA